MRRILPLLIISIFWHVIPGGAQTKTDTALAGLNGAVSIIKYEVSEFTPKGGKSVEGRRTLSQTVTYDARGNRVKRVDFNADGSVAQTLVYTRDAQGRATGYEEYTGTLSTPRRHVYVLGERENRIEYRITQPDGAAGEKYLYRYDAKGNVAEESLFEHKGALITRNVYAYDDRARLVSQTRYNPDDSVSATISNAYDAATGKLAEQVRYESDILVYRVRFAYDHKGRLVEQITVGSVVETDVASSEANAPGRVVYVYNGKGQQHEAIAYAPDGSVREKVVSEYDSRGNWIRRTRLARPGGSRRWEPRRVDYRAITYY